MEVRDPVHGSIHILEEVVPIIQHDFFQRLRNIKQLGFSEYVFPGATHTRFIHSIGVMDVGNKAFQRIFQDHSTSATLLKIRETFKLACLLHDIGHGPLSHSTEYVMPPVKDLKIPISFLASENLDRKATHEDYTIKSIADSSFSESFKRIEDKFGVERKYIAHLIQGRTDNPSYFTLKGVNYFPILSQLVSSELDCDRMDYLLRDSYFCGVSYGNFDLDWLLDNLSPAIINDQAYLSISERAVITFDDFLLSRYHMFIMVYFHYRAVCLEQLLYKYFRSSPEEYKIPADIEKYCEHDDHYLMKIMRNSKNKYAQRIVKNNIPPKIYESFSKGQHENLEKIALFLEQEKIDYIKCSSSGRLSKYYNEGKGNETCPELKVLRTLTGSDRKIYYSIHDATNLFEKYSTAHSINRLHCDVEDLNKKVQNELFKIINSNIGHKR